MTLLCWRFSDGTIESRATAGGVGGDEGVGGSSAERVTE